MRSGCRLQLGPVALIWILTGPGSVWTQIGGFFSAMAVVTFGGAYAVLAYVAQAAVDGFGWLAPGEMLDGLGLAETTPGPLILVLQFVGFLAGFRAPGPLPPLVAGSLGALLTLWVTFAPCFLWIFLGAPYVEALRARPRACCGARCDHGGGGGGDRQSGALVFGLHVLFGELRSVSHPRLQPGACRCWPRSDWRAALLSAAAAILLLRLKLGMMPVLAILPSPASCSRAVLG